MPTETGAVPDERRAGVARCLAAALLASLAAAAPCRAQGIGLLVLADGEGWLTDSASFLTARNQGDPLAIGRLTAWLTVRPVPRLELLALAWGEAGSDGSRVGNVDQLQARYTFSPAFAVEGGKILNPVGAFARRRFSNVNPLVGRPDTYPPGYALGGLVSGTLGRFDYRLGAVDEAPLDPRYIPEPGHALRPVGAVGFRFGAPLRVGVSATHGPYLGDGDTVVNNLPPGLDPDTMMQTLVGVEAHFSVGHLDAYGEFLWSRYDVPTYATPIDGRGWYVEARYTLSPRVFVAARVEANDYVFVLPINQFFWVGNPRMVQDVEVGAGYRFGATTLLKASYRRDRWPDPDPPAGPAFPDGYAWAVQFSHMFDVGQVFAKRY